MTHQQMFHAADNDEGYISVIVHRERFEKDLLAMGWVKTQAETVKKVTQKLAGKKNDTGVNDSK